jgi:hypothetical protein
MQKLHGLLKVDKIEHAELGLNYSILREGRSHPPPLPHYAVHGLCSQGEGVRFFSK